MHSGIKANVDWSKVLLKINYLIKMKYSLYKKLKIL